MYIKAFIIVYVVGGLTFIPLLICLVLLHAYLTFPTRETTKDGLVKPEREPSGLEHPDDDEFSLKTGTDSLAEKFHRKHEEDVAAGYFAVCREYVPGGVNGKPPERTTPAGEVVAAESPSVYQSMYRSIFDRKEKPSIEPAKGNARSVKRARNVFFVVLRHGHLMLYDDSEQIEVRHVISLEYHDVSIYGGGEEQIPEGQLWLKRNAICLRRKPPMIADVGVTSLPFFLFCENTSDKEDFYFALLKNQQQIPGNPNPPPEPLKFDTKDIISLVQRLHSSQEHLQTRWINALIGRLFLSMYKTPIVEAFIRTRVVKKISRVKKPSFITKIVLHKLEMGDSGPFLTNPRLRDLTVNGDCTVEADFKYNGNFRIEIGATLKIDLGTRFKAREVDIVLAVVVKRLEGHAMVRFKPPPSNRIWFTFETMPTVEMTIEPIVSTRQITYTVILRQIESRIREVIAESMVLPFWDDVSFMDTEGQEYRGGIWKQERTEEKYEEIKDEDPEDEAEAGGEGIDVSQLKSNEERTMSVPTVAALSNLKLRANKSTKSLAPSLEASSASTTGIDKIGKVEPPRAIRSNSFATPADPKVTANNASADSAKRDSINTLKKDAAAAMKEISDRSLSSSPVETPYGSPPSESLVSDGNLVSSGKQQLSTKSSKQSLGSDASAQTASAPATLFSGSQPPIAPSPTASSFAESGTNTLSRRTGTFASLTGSQNAGDKRQTIPTISAATEAAKKWGLGMMARNNSRRQESGRPGTPEYPIGRGQPLPPPGQPLPPPQRNSRGSIPSLPSLPSLPRRKPIPPALPERKTGNGNGSASMTPATKPPLPERRQRRSTSHVDEEGSDEVYVVEAPTESAPGTPTDETQEEFFGQLEDHVDGAKGAAEEHVEQAAKEKPPLPARDLQPMATNGEPPVPERDLKVSVEDAAPPLPVRDLEATAAEAEEHEALARREESAGTGDNPWA